LELRLLLEAAGLKPPFILVAHSFGGLVARRYALMYPEQVVGVVLIDPMRCEEWPPLDAGKQSQVDRGKRLIRYASPIAHCGLARLAVTSAFRRSGKLSNQLAGAAGSGAQHVLGRIKTEVGKMPREVWPIVAAHWSRPGFYSGMRMYLQSIPDTVMEMDAAEPIRDISITLLTPGESTPVNEAGLQRIGNRVQQIIASESAHWIHLDEPDLVIESIRSMIANSVAAETASVQ
jgi:pimeloyl-ACP methyl ester carboxylesterase